MERPTRFPDEIGKLHVASIFYDVAVDGGTVGVHTIPGILPNGAQILGVNLAVLSNFTSAASTATVALALWDGTNAYAVKAATIVTDLDAGRAALAAETAYKLGGAGTVFPAPAAAIGDVQLRATVAVQTATAGKLVAHVFYVMSPNAEIEE